MTPLSLTPQHALWPRQLARRLTTDFPAELRTLGNPDLLRVPATALFCSARCPGEAILQAYDQAAHWRDTGRAVIGGFHSPMEKECLRILLRGPQPIILCPARGLPRRLPPELHPALVSGRLLILSPFPDSEARVTRELAERRNLLVAALASEVWFAHISPDGQMAELAKHVEAWRDGSGP